MDDIKVVFWYEEIVLDVDKTIDAIEYWKRCYEFGRNYTKAKGVIAKLLAEQPQLGDYEFILTDAEMIHKWFDETLKHMKAKKRIDFIRDPDLKAEFGGDLKKTEVDNLVLLDDDIRYYINLQLMVELWKNTLKTLINRFDKRGMTITMIAKLRIAGEHEAFIDTTHETNPEHL